jgi:hypothetical protein
MVRKDSSSVWATAWFAGCSVKAMPRPTSNDKVTKIAPNIGKLRFMILLLLFVLFGFVSFVTDVTDKPSGGNFVASSLSEKS